MELKGRTVVDVEIDGVDTRDFPDFCDAYFTYAVFEDTGEELTVDELNELMDNYPEVIGEMAFEHYI